MATSETAPPTTNGASSATDEIALPAWQKSIPTLHRLDHSQAHRVLWALQEIHDYNGLKFNNKNYPRQAPKNEALLKVSPMGKSPILTVDDLEGKPVPNVQLVDGVLMETRLILEYISETYGGKDLWEPETDAEKRRDIYFREFACNSLLERVDQPLVIEVIPEILPFPFKQLLKLIFSPILKVLRNFQHEHYKHMESNLSDEFPYFAGKKLGIADYCFEFPVSVAIKRKMLDTTMYPKIGAWHERITSREAYQTAIVKGGGPAKYDLEFFGMKGQRIKMS